MKLFRQLHGRRTPRGLESQILRRLPRIALIGSLLPAALSMLVRIIPPEPGIDRAKHIKSVDIFAISTEITLLTAVFTVAIGCFVVYVMKGPAYVADAYPLEHADRPAPERDDSPESG
jgi:preprotein translocase subunit SecY